MVGSGCHVTRPFGGAVCWLAIHLCRRVRARAISMVTQRAPRDCSPICGYLFAAKLFFYLARPLAGSGLGRLTRFN